MRYDKLDHQFTPYETVFGPSVSDEYIVYLYPQQVNTDLHNSVELHSAS